LIFRLLLNNLGELQKLMQRLSTN